MIIAVDFDGTLVTHQFPKIGVELPYAIRVLQKLQQKGHKVFLWTMRGHPDTKMFGHTVHIDGKDCGDYIEQDTLQEALDWCKERGLEFDGVNESPAQFSTSNKQYAKVYIDDAALGCPLRVYPELDKSSMVAVDWERIAVWFRDTGYFTDEELLEVLGIYHGHKFPTKQ